MSTPTQKHTRSSKRIRRAALKGKKIQLSKCPKCKQVIRQHTACAFCGFYKGREVLKVRVPKKLRNKRSKKQEKE